MRKISLTIVHNTHHLLQIALLHMIPMRLSTVILGLNNRQATVVRAPYWIILGRNVHFLLPINCTAVRLIVCDRQTSGIVSYCGVAWQ